MILWVVKCKECNKDLFWDYRDTHLHKEFRVVIETHNNPCEKCHHSDVDKQEHSFCSLKCMKKWVESCTGEEKDWDLTIIK